MMTKFLKVNTLSLPRTEILKAGKDLERSVQKILRAQSKAGGGARRRILELLASSGVEPARAGLRSMLIEKEEPGAAVSNVCRRPRHLNANAG